jgi:hypothetical protein
MYGNYNLSGKQIQLGALSAIQIAEQTPIALTTPFYTWSELRFYRFVLGINWRTGRRLVNLGVLIPDGYSDDRPLFLADGPSIQRHRQAIADYRTAPKRRAKPL